MRFVLKLIVAVVAFFATLFILRAFSFYYGALNFMIAFVVAIAAFMLIKSSAAKAEVVKASHGTPSFSWRDFAVYRDQGFLTFKGVKYLLSDVTKIEYDRRYGQATQIHVHVRDMKTPRLTMRVSALTAAQSAEIEDQYERLRMALGIS